MIPASTLGELVYDSNGLRVYFDSSAGEWAFTPVMIGRGCWRKMKRQRTAAAAVAWAVGYAEGVSAGIDGEHVFVSESAKVNILA